MRSSLQSGLCAAWLATALGMVTPASAHHSFSEYKFDKTEALAGTVVWVGWGDPHNLMRMMASDGTVWTMEFGTPGTNLRLGWKADTLQVGQKIQVTYAPKADDSHGGSMRTVTLPDGRTLRTPISYLFGKDAVSTPKTPAPAESGSGK